jgi:hypothetical protein
MKEKTTQTIAIDIDVHKRLLQAQYLLTMRGKRPSLRDCTEQALDEWYERVKNEKE